MPLKQLKTVIANKETTKNNAFRLCTHLLLTCTHQYHSTPVPAIQAHHLNLDEKIAASSLHIHTHQGEGGDIKKRVLGL
jgi:hypothetical protein